MELGWLDVCLRVQSVRVSRPYYEGLGFRRVEGDDDQGWAVMVQGDARIGLYEPAHMGDDAYCLNFRGGDVPALATELKAKGYAFSKDLQLGKDGGGSAWLKDPDGHAIFLDCAPGETKKT